MRAVAMDLSSSSQITTLAEKHTPRADTGRTSKWHEFLGWYVAALLLLLLILAVDGWTRQQDMRNHMEKELHDCVTGFQ